MSTMILGVLCFCAFIAQSYGADSCEQLPPQAGYDAKKEFAGTYYLIGMKKGFEYQSQETNCVSSTVIDDPSDRVFTFTISEQDTSGNINTINITMESISPGVLYQKGDTFEFTGTVIGFIENQLRIVHACNDQTNEYAVWINSKTRVNGIKNLEQNQYDVVKQTLEKYNIPMDSIKDIQNEGCTN